MLPVHELLHTYFDMYIGFIRDEIKILDHYNDLILNMSVMGQDILSNEVSYNESITQNNLSGVLNFLTKSDENLRRVFTYFVP